MAIQQLEIRGCRSFKEAAWRPGKLNLLVGPIGGSKSNLLRTGPGGKVLHAFPFELKADAQDWLIAAD
jgi:hypothetical protein